MSIGDQSEDPPLKVLITGAQGFVGPFLVEELKASLGPSVAIISSSKRASSHPTLGNIIALDVLDAAAVEEQVAALKPTHIVHLAGIAAIPAAASDHELAWQIHLYGTLNMARAILKHAPGCCFLFVGSGQVYGASAQSGAMLDEGVVLAPTNDYAATKAAADLALGVLALQGLKCIRLRPFNHTGPGQTEDFVAPSFAAQIARIEAGLQHPTIHVGNLDAQRDFLDVRDVARAYVQAVKRSAELKSGVILNISSGTPVSIELVLNKLLQLTTASIVVERDPARMRPSDTPCYVGDSSRARALLNWSPQISLDTTLRDLLDDFRRKTAAGPSTK